ncbi:flagellar export chaperone FliS [Natranaerobius thermophilus]|uniref:Flagellar secretion chaperone FliS n=1 Tax=Natranaerobius thermophilus (strain ATCC BAA-1301 / DSM 18059 / JW/NM-WN-LF) TaxID=457570 RepID=B2A822_NATTJ|nr:flagellar export chaperone FliS [Natranaerobius thermophilus]ACB85794.1 flagellar protein FliS [Natranaerobius thermophilus JW/NM-WN-LF]
MYGQNPYNNYKETQIKTASSEKLLLMLFDGGLKFMKQAKGHLENKELKQANEKLKRAQSIVAELMNSLDTNQGEVATNLWRLYDFMLNELIQANIKKDTEKIDQVMKMMRELRQTFDEASKSAGSGKNVKTQAGGIVGKA